MKNDERKRGGDNIGSSVSFNPYVLTFLCIKLRGYRSIRDRCSFFFLLPPFRRFPFQLAAPASLPFYGMYRDRSRCSTACLQRRRGTRENSFSLAANVPVGLCSVEKSFIFLPLAIIVYTTILMYLESSRFGDFRGLDFEGNKRD